ncbi:MAG: antitoxin [bacterium]
MAITKVFKSGNSQAVRIPAELQLNVKEVEIFSRGDELIIRPKRDNLSDVMDIFAAFPDDFMEGKRDDPPPQERDFNL